VSETETLLSDTLHIGYLWGVYGEMIQLLLVCVACGSAQPVQPTEKHPFKVLFFGVGPRHEHRHRMLVMLSLNSVTLEQCPRNACAVSSLFEIEDWRKSHVTMLRNTVPTDSPHYKPPFEGESPRGGNLSREPYGTIEGGNRWDYSKIGI